MGTKQPIGTLSSVPVRDVWPDEARDLTPWLAENPEVLSEALGLELELEGQEVPVGPFSADLLFRDITTDHLVVVENMINPTDHDHVGKMITYAAGLEGHYAVLIAERFRPEHRTALAWLNSISETDVGFFGVSLEVWRIGESAPAPKLHVEVQPDNWAKVVRATASHSLTTTQAAYLEFWGQFLERFHESYEGWSKANTAPKGSWVSVRSAHPSVRYSVAFCRPQAEYQLRIEAYIDTGDEESGEALFDALAESRESVEPQLGAQLDWDRLDERRACRISWYFPESVRVLEEERWPELLDWLMPRMGQMRSAFDPLLAEL